MNYTEAIDYIESKNSLGIVPGLELILALLEKLDHPERKIPALHIAGTNGKGSVMAFIEHSLLAAGLSVGRYLSPAVTDYLEKWQINGQMVTKEDLAECMDEVRAAAETMPQSPTAFELETAVAFLLFQKKNCDVMLIECGMGGRLDATNVIPSKVVNILASVSLDHMQYLGDTREKILMEKLGIVQPGDVLVSAPLDPVLRAIMEHQVFQWKEADRSALRILSQTIRGTDFTYFGEKYHINMPGQVAVENAITAITALEMYNRRAREFGLPEVTAEQIRTGLAETNWQGRFTVFDTKPQMIVDGAHNRDAWRRLAESLVRFYKTEKITFILGVLADKEVDAMLEQLMPLAKRVYTFTPDSPRALAGDALAERIRQYCAAGCADSGVDHGVDHGVDSGMKEAVEVEVMDDASSAACTALRNAEAGDHIVACGSLTFLGELLEKQSSLEMFRVERILEDPFYKTQIKKIYESELDRIFCRHGFGHAVSVARIAYILTMEEKLPFRKDVIYGAALLHDVGRYTPEEKEMSHHEAGAVYAKEILRRAGYDEEETEMICSAIRAHKDPDDRRDSLESVLYRADKLSRNCFVCDAREECYWPEERKNKTILC